MIKKGLRISLISLAVLLILTSILLPFISSATKKSGTEKIDNRVFNEINNTNQARVIITFRNSFGSALPFGILSEKINYSTAKKELENTLKAKVAYDLGNSISAVISQQDLSGLENNQNVDSVQLVGFKQVFLQDSVPLINATGAWNFTINGVNVTGKGETVCVIDTGVDFMHPDLGGCYGYNNVSSGCKILGGIDYCADNSTCTTVDDNVMDVYGHGTHVSGIIAANGGLKGVAPDADIIMIKAANGSGDLPDDAIVAGINWCVNNASIFNISVISMSFGGSDLYSSYCDGKDDPAGITGAINNAVAHNISVIVAAGNNYSYTGISSPACIENATAVASSTKTDAVSPFSNRNSITDLIAPGGTIGGSPCSPGNMDPNRICSTANGGGYIAFSGTSMATPHVAGAFALIHEYKKLEGQIITPQEIQTALQKNRKADL